MATELVKDELDAAAVAELNSAADEVRAAMAELAAFSARRAEAEADLKAEAQRLRARNEAASQRYNAARKRLGPGVAPDYATVLQAGKKG